MSEEYQFRTLPFQHQYDYFIDTRDLESHAILWEQGTGKTKLVIDTACYLYEKEKIDGLLIVAPNGAQQNWILNEIPIHTPERIDSLSMAYRTATAGSKQHLYDSDRLIKFQGLSILAMSYNSFVTKRGSALAKRFLKKRKTFFVADESHHIKTIGRQCKRTRYMIAAAKLAVYKRIMSGTQADNPFDLYAPLQFLNKEFWKDHGFASYQAYKTFFGIWEAGWNPGAGKEYQKLVSYRNLDKIHAILETISSRVLKEDVLDLPPKLYSYCYVEMTPEQNRMYCQLRDQFIVELADGREIEAPLAVVRLIRLQQILCGYVPSEDEGEPVHLLPNTNPRLKALEELCQEVSGKAIIWARFRMDINLICEMLVKNGYEAVRYDGAVDQKDRPEAIERFQKGDAKFLVGNPEAGGESLTLHAANTVIYYNNSFKLRQRLQSEDRAHRIGQNHPVNYIDIISRGTIDDHIVRNLRRKFDVAAEINGDRLREWLNESL